MNLLFRRSLGWFDIPEKEALIALVDDVQQGEPYFNEPGEIPAASWLPNSCRDTSLIFTAYHWPSVYPIGFCIMKPFEQYTDFENDGQTYGINPKTSIYIAELGVSEATRGMGVGLMLLNFGMKQCPFETTHYLVRTMKGV
ncbi:MAG: GNAT family N-acetyltransferase, partial [Chloroflexota bacterium]